MPESHPWPAPSLADTGHMNVTAISYKACKLSNETDFVVFDLATRHMGGRQVNI